MGLLDRVNQANQQRAVVPGPTAATVAPPPVAPPSNGAPAPVAQPVAAGVAAPAAPPPAAPPAPSGGSLADRSGGNTGAVAVTPAFAAAKTAVHAKLLEQYANKIDVTDREFVKEKIVELSEEYIRTSGMTMTRPDRERLIESLMDDILGLGPLEILLNDKDITEIM